MQLSVEEIVAKVALQKDKQRMEEQQRKLIENLKNNNRKK